MFWGTPPYRNRLRDLVLEHYKSLANTIESKIELTKKSMFNKAEASSLSIKDKQRLTKIIENKITPIENRAKKLRNQLREKREKKASRNNVRIPNPQSPRHPNGKCGNKPAFPRKQAAHHRMRPYPPPQYHHIPTQRHAHTCHKKRPHPPPPQYHHIPTQSHNPPPTPHVTQTTPTPPNGTHSSTSTSIPTNQAPTINVSQASPTTGTPTSPQASPPELRSSDEAEYPLKSNSKECRRFRRYNHNNQHKQKPNRVQNNDHCVNLSSCTLTKEETSILSKGLGFVPTPPIPHPSAIQKDINKFARTLRLKYEFQQNRPKKRKFKPQSNYIPPPHQRIIA